MLSRCSAQSVVEVGLGGSFLAKMFEVGFCLFHALIRGFAIPFRRFGFILFDALAVVIADAKTILSICMSLFRGFAVPFHGLGIVLFDTLTVSIAGLWRILRRK